MSDFKREDEDQMGYLAEFPQHVQEAYDTLLRARSVANIADAVQVLRRKSGYTQEEAEAVIEIFWDLNLNFIHEPSRDHLVLPNSFLGYFKEINVYSVEFWTISIVNLTAFLFLVFASGSEQRGIVVFQQLFTAIQLFVFPGWILVSLFLPDAEKERKYLHMFPRICLSGLVSLILSIPLVFIVGEIADEVSVFILEGFKFLWVQMLLFMLVMVRYILGMQQQINGFDGHD